MKKLKITISKLQEKLWAECKRIIRARYGNTCYTCGRSGLEGSNWHTGHMFPKGALGGFLKYDLRLLRPQCYHCNINLGGNGAIFIENMRKREGNEYVDGIIRDKNTEVRAYDHYELLLVKYKEIKK